MTMNDLSVTNSINSLDIMEKSLKFAEIIAKSDIIPGHYRGKTANVFIAMQTAYRRNLDPMMFMAGTYVYRGVLSLYSQFAISLANVSGLLQTRIRYEIAGKDEELVVTAFAKLKESDKEISFTIGMKQAIEEGWTQNSKYKTLPELMLRYRAATLLIRTHIPEVLNGLHTVEEIEDIQTYNTVSNAQDLSDKLKEIDSIEVSIPPIEEEVEETLIPAPSKYEELFELIKEHKISQETVDKWCAKAGVASLGELDEGKLGVLIPYVTEKYGHEQGRM